MYMISLSIPCLQATLVFVSMVEWLCCGTLWRNLRVLGKQSMTCFEKHLIAKLPLELIDTWVSM